MFIAERITNELEPAAASILRDAVQRLEDDIAAPVRLMQPETDRTVDGYLNRWTGNSGNMTHYPSYTEEDRNTRGVTILGHSWRPDQNNEWRFIEANPEVIDTWLPRFQGDATPTISFEVYVPEAAAIETAGGTPLTFNDDTEHTFGALYEERVMFVGIGLGFLRRYGTINWDEWLFDTIRLTADPALREAAEQRRAERNQSVFAQMMHEQGDYALVELRQRSAELGSRIGATERQLANDQSQFTTVGRQLDVLLTDGNEITDERINTEWNSILNHAQVRSVRLGTGQGENPHTGGMEELPYMDIDSEDLWITVPALEPGRRRYREGTARIEGRHMPLGQFTIRLDFGRLSTNIHNNTMRMNNRWDHPHVSDGELCTGEFGRTITIMLQRRQLAPMVNMIFQILRVTSLGDEWGGRNILLWAERDDQLRRDEGWPAWESGEDVHPLLAQQQEQGGQA